MFDRFFSIPKIRVYIYILKTKKVNKLNLFLEFFLLSIKRTMCIDMCESLAPHMTARGPWLSGVGRYVVPRFVYF